MMNTPKPNDDLANLAQVASYKAYLSLMPQIHHKTVNMSSGATSAEPLKQTHPLEYNELIKKADEVVCMHFDGDSNDKHIDREEARKATQVAADSLYHQIAPKHNNSSPAPLNNIDDTHSSSKESPSSYKTPSASNSNGTKHASPNDAIAFNVAASPNNSVPLQQTRTEVDDSIPFERAVPGDAASDTQNLSIDSLPARIDETNKINPACIGVPPEVDRYPSHLIADMHKPESSGLNHGLSKSRNLMFKAASDTSDKVTNSSGDNTKYSIEEKGSNNEDPLLLKQHVSDDTCRPGDDTTTSGTLDQLKCKSTKVNGNDSTFNKIAESDDHGGNTGNDKIKKKVSVSRDVALAGNGISAQGLSSSAFNRTPLKTRANPNKIGVEEMKNERIHSKNNVPAGHIGSTVGHSSSLTDKNDILKENANLNV